MTDAAPTRGRGDPLLLPASEASLLLVHLAVAVGFARLYGDASFLTTLAAYTITAHVLAVLTRRSHLPVLLTAAVAVVGAVLLSSWLVFPDSLAAGLPTAATWSELTDAVTEARSQFRVVVAPAPVLPGFQVLAGLALWAAAWFSDWAAMRLRTTIEAVAPALVLFFFASLLGSGDHQVLSAALFSAAVLLYVATHRAYRASVERAWVKVSDRTARGPHSVLTTSCALGVVAVLVGLAAAPHIPGHDDPAVFTWRAKKKATESRTVGDPFVDLRSRLVDQSEVELFRVQANRSAYWRLTSLENFDGLRWTSSGLYSAASGHLPVTTYPGLTRQISQRYLVSGLRSDWVPAAFQATNVSSGQGMRWNKDSGSLIIDEDEPGLTPGFVYEVESVAPLLDPDLLRRMFSQPQVDPGYLSLPAGINPMVRDQAIDAVGGAVRPYDQAVTLQNWFRDNFEYSLDVQPQAGDPLVNFLSDRIGYCEQFAGTYATMARMLGIPARVAVGFTQGDLDPETGEYVVRGRHAHAWPEVHLGEAGWVAFEPTPNRGMPDAESYTGIPPQQEETPVGPLPSEASTTTTVPVAPPPPDPPETSASPTTPVSSSGEGADGSRPAWMVLSLAVLLLVALWAGVLLAVPWVRRRRSRGVSHPGRKALLAWEQALVPVRWTTGYRPRDSETYIEFAQRSHRGLGDRAPTVALLAALATRASWDPDGVGDDEAESALSTAESLWVEASRQGTLVRRVRRRLSWRELRAQRPRR